MSAASPRHAERPLLVFVSSVIAGLKEERSAVRRGAERVGLVGWVLEETPASSDALDESYLKHVREAEFVVWLVGRVDDRSRGDGDPPRPRIASPAAAWSSCLRTVSRTTARDRCWQRSSCESSTARSRRRRSRQPSATTLEDERRRAVRLASGSLGAGARLAPPPADLVARTAELDRAVAWFEESPEHRIIAISGMPAVGKSAFALTLAARLRDALPDGEVGIELRGVDHPLRTEEIVTQVLSVFEQGESNPEDSPGRRRAIAEVLQIHGARPSSSMMRVMRNTSPRWSRTTRRV